MAIKCSSAKHANAKDSPVAVKCCLSCSAYLCASCDASTHVAEKSKHYTFQVSKLKSFVHFDPKGKPENESHIRRHLDAPSGPKFVPFNGHNTFYEAFHGSCNKYGSNPAMGQRGVLSNGSIGPYSYITYKTFQSRVNNFGNALAHLGLDNTSPPRIGLYSLNRSEWSIAEFASYNFSFVPVPLYDTLGPEAANHIIQQSQIQVVVSTHERLESLLTIAASNPQLKAIVLMPLLPYDKPVAKATSPVPSTVRVWTFADFEKFGSDKPKIKHFPPTKDAIATICYTSGTTGVPKGAVLTHGNMISDLGAVVAHGMNINSSDSHISYLPLAHMFERLSIAMNYFQGAQVSFARGNPLLLLEDIEAARPTVFVGVPRLYNRLYDKVLAGVEESGKLKKWLFDTAYASKVHNLTFNKQLKSTIWDRIIFSKIAAKLGGRVRLMITGSAPISDNVMTFLRVCFSAEVLEGYGQTEGAAAFTLTLPNEHSLANVGVPLLCNEIKLVDVPDMNYTNKDIINGVPHPRGEVCSRGFNVFSGYYLDKEKTAEAIDSDGWLHSGDIGMILPDGSLKIIDRKKNIFKLSQGEYIAPEKCENVYLSSKYVAQAFVYGDSLQSCLVGIIVPDEETLTAWAKRNKITADFKKLCTMDNVKALILEDMATVAKEKKLQGFEQVKDIVLSSTLWTPENDMLTPTMKLKRNAVQKKFQNEIDSMYSRLATSNSEKKAFQEKRPVKTNPTSSINAPLIKSNL